MDVVIRSALPRDRRAVFAAIRTIWGGNDYLLRTFDRWVRMRRDRLFVAELGGRVVGVARLAWFSQTDAWLETLRVHPRYRRRGIGGALMRHRIALARAAGARRIAFSTESRNRPQLRSARRLGFRRLATLEGAVARARAGETARLAGAGDAAAIWRVAQAAAAREPALILRGGGWRWQRLARDDVVAAIRARRCYVSDGPRGVRAFAIVETDRDGQDLRVRAFAGSPAGSGDLLARLRAVAHLRRLATVSVYRPKARLPQTFATAGYRTPWRYSAAYFELALRGAS